MPKINLSVSAGVVRESASSPKQRQITAICDDTRVSLDRAAKKHGRTALLNFSWSGNPCTLRMQDSHGVWGKHQDTPHEQATFNTLFGELSLRPDMPIAVDAEIRFEGAWGASSVAGVQESAVHSSGANRIDERQFTELARRGESHNLEFKAAFRRDKEHQLKKSEDVIQNCIKAVAGLLNADGGLLLLGVAPDGVVVGVDEEAEGDLDKYQRTIIATIGSGLGNYAATCVEPQILCAGNKAVCVLHCKRAAEPVFLKNPKKGTGFFVRQGTRAVELAGQDLLQYDRDHFSRGR